MKIVFIADVFADEVPGGGELVNQEVINLLRADGHTVTQIKSQDVNSDFVIQENSQGSKFILGNFLALKPGAVSALLRPNISFMSTIISILQLEIHQSLKTMLLLKVK